jgi:predicted ATP-grasp superfamily ATP-dependent carboligase
VLRDPSTGWRRGSASTGTLPTHLDAVVLDAALRQALVAVRALGRQGRTVGAVEMQSEGPVPTFSSRYCACHAEIAERSASGQAAALVALLQERRADVVIPSHDGTIEMLRSHRDDIERWSTVALAAEPALAVAVDKDATLRIASELGIPVPRSVTVREQSDVDAAIAEIGLPAVLKPSRSWVGTDADAIRLSACAVDDAERARVELRRLLEQGGSVLVQEYVPGSREAVSFVRRGGTFAGEFAQRALRTFPALGGSSVLRESIALPADAIVDARKLVDALDLDGYAEVEFRRDANRRAVLMEINPRLSASVEVAVRAGVDMPSLVLAWARGEALPTSDPYQVGVRMRWLGGDLAWLRESWNRQGAPEVQSRAASVTEFARTVRHRNGYDYFDRSDLRPALTAVSRGASDVLRRARRRATSTTRAVRDDDVDAVIIGAGPYGLSIAAHYGVGGIDHRIFGTTMSTWRDHMPKGMTLRSENAASNLSDPRGELTLADYCADHAPDIQGNATPVPLSVFNDYASWFVEQAGVKVENEMVRRLSRRDGGFTLELENGEVVRSRRVVMATGVSHFAYVPQPYSELPAELCSHTSRFDRLDGFAGKDVTIIGVGQSARETAALLNEHGATVRCLAQTSWIRWDGPPIAPDRSLIERLRLPEAGMGAGWEPWLFEHLPREFRLLPAEERVRLSTQRFGPTGGWWLRPRVEGVVPLLLGRVVRSLHPEADGVRIEVDGPDGHETYRSDHIIAATGYRVDLRRLTFMDAALRDELRMSGPSPVLGRGFESSVPRLHFVGMAAAASYGPMNRFVLGTRFASTNVAKASRR